MVFTLAAFLRVVGTEFDPSPPPAPASTEPSPTAHLWPSDATFDQVLHLRSFAGEIKKTTGDEPILTLWLDWDSSGQVDHVYYVSIIPVAPDGQTGPATLQQPFEGRYPTTCWLPASGRVRDRLEVPLPLNRSSGDWWVSLALIDGDTGVKVPVTQPDGSQDDQVGLGPFPTPN
jgi:hypothetical protein